MATWNGERFLREQLESIYAQSWDPIEVVVSDDASTDGTMAILEEYSESRGLRYSRNEQQLGLVRNFERAIEMCKGEFIALSDQDDLWKPMKVERLIAGIGGATLAYCGVQEVLELDGVQHDDRTLDRILQFERAHGGGHPTRHLLAENWVVSHTLLFRRDLVAKALPIPPSQRYHDGWLALLASKMDGLAFVDERLQAYRRHQHSLTFKAPKAASGPRWRRFLSGRFRADWQRRCHAEAARLGDALERAGLDPAERRFVHTLLRFYGAAEFRGSRWQACRAGLQVFPFFATNVGRGRWLFSLRAFFGQ
jgi:glycosyltransferase involved in cell wall biosynthesis